jgi:molecular chaperone DnaJ
VSPAATADEIRDAYRDLARRHHPDRAVAGGQEPSDAMSRVNEAYRVLSEPGRRALYDRSLHAAVGATPSSVDVTDVGDVDVEPAAQPSSSPLSPAGPARIPWKLMAVTAVLGSAVVLVAAAFTDPPADEPPDGILRTGSCIEIESNGDAREVACTGEGDTVVELLIPTGARCPVGTSAHRDRLGLGTACIAG